MTYGLLLGKAEQQALASQQQIVVARMAGAEITADWPSMAAAQEQLDALLDAESTRSGANSEDREFLELLGVA